MKFLSTFFSKLYQYATVCIVVGSPLFFIPNTSFSPDVTYYVTMGILVAIALLSYVVSALITRSWHSLSRLEFISYFAFSLAVILSVLFAKNQRFSLFGEVLEPASGAALLSLPVIMYLVRTLPEKLRHTLKLILGSLLGISAFTFVTALMYNGAITSFTKQIFSGFISPVSFAIYIGLFAVACLFFVFKGTLPKKHKIAIGITGVLFFMWAFAISAQDGVRPNFTSTMLVGKGVMLNEGVFGIGSGNFTRAWQLYRPQSVINSEYFGYDFNQGSSTMSTIFVTLGIFGLLSFLFLVISALYNTVMTYRQNKEGQEHFILGFLSVSLMYLLVASFFLPFSYAMLVVWMVVSGLGLAKTKLTEYHPSKKIAFLMIPLTVILVSHMFITIDKVRAFSVYSMVQTAKTPEDSLKYLVKAAQIYPYDGFYRLQVEQLIQANRNLVSVATDDQEALKNEYLETSKKAVDAALFAVKLNPNSYQNYVSLGRAYELAIPFDKENGFDRAKKAYEEAVKLYKDNPYLYLMLARLESSAGTKEGVRQNLTDALKKKQNFTDALYLMSQLEASDSKIDEAINYAVEAIKSSPNEPLVYIQAGLLFYGKKDYENAVYALKVALEKDQNNANVAYFLALALRDGGRPDIAKQIAEELLKRNPDNADLVAFIKTLEVKAEPVLPETTKKTKK
ncbi:MAG: tetratricopeptide repeat protein [Candidatus Pacebacteria bacterium]|nr:tetratricopeptide repeat protein [Candidatus Paceibacterota bacterium]MBP9866767.1 tetratricopeptide repeat protein [Candidatus Paceibacterota bacterium]